VVQANAININIESFLRLTGCELDHFTANVMRGDAWGTFMKLAAVIEASSKRAIALKRRTDPSSQAAMKRKFFAALHLCHEEKLISGEAYDFADCVRDLRNELVHTGSRLDLDVERFTDAEYFRKYQEKVGAFVDVEKNKISDGIRQHLNVLLVGCVAFISQLAKNILGEEWVMPSPDRDSTT
jgi:hypothetical protein